MSEQKKQLWTIGVLIVLCTMAMKAQNTVAPFKVQQANTQFYVNMAGGAYSTVQKTVTAACAYATAAQVVILPGANPPDSPTTVTGCSNVKVYDESTLPWVVYASTGGLYTASSLVPVTPTLTLQTNGTNNSSQSALNFQTSTANAAGLTVTPSNPSGGNERLEVTGTVNAAHGGTGTDLSAATGVLQAAGGAISASTALANGTTATTQAAGDASSKVATDGFVSAAVPIHPIGSLVTTDCTASPQTLLITSSLAITGTATFTHCNLLAQEGGFITGSGTLACVQCTITNQTGGAIFGTSLVLSGLSYDRLSWHSVIGYSSAAAAVAGSDYSAQVLQGMAATSGTGMLYIPCLYYRADSLGTVTYAFQMMGECKPTASTQPPLFLSTNASANILFVQGVSTGNLLNYGSIQDINFSRTAKPTGTPPTTGVGIGLKNAGGWIIREVGSSNSNSDFYCSQCPEFGVGIWDNVAAGWSALAYTSADTNLIGFEFAPPDGIGNESSLIRNWKVSATPLKATGAFSTGLSIHGSAINDFQSNTANVADTKIGISVVATSPTLVSDIHFANNVLQTDSAPIVVSGVQGNTTQSGSGIDFVSTWAQSSFPSTVTNSNGVGFVSYQNLGFSGAFTFSGATNNYVQGLVSQGSGSTIVDLGSGSNNNRIEVYTNDPKAADTIPSVVKLSGTSLYNEIHANCTGAATFSTCVTNSDATSSNNYAFVEAPTSAAPCSGLQCSDHSSIGLNSTKSYRVGASPASGFGSVNWGYIYDGTPAQANFTALFSSGAAIGSHYNLFTMPSDGGFGWGTQAGTAITGAYACDTQFFKIAPGSVGVNNCTSASTVNGSFSATNLTANGLTTANGIPMHTSGGLFQESTIVQQSNAAATTSTYLVFPGATRKTYAGTVADGQLFFGGNCFFNGTNWVYGVTGACSEYRANASSSGSGMSIVVAPSGTAGATVTGNDTTQIGVAALPSANGPQWQFNPGTHTPLFGTNNVVTVNPYRTADNLANVQITTNATTNKALVLQATASQSANMLEVQDSTGAVKASVSPVGLGAFATGSTVNGSLICTAAGVVGCGTGSGTVTTSGSPLSGYLSFFTGATVVSGTAAATLDTSGNMGVATLNNTTSANDSSIAMSTAGTIVTRNIADGTPVMTVTNSNATSGGTALKVTTAGVGNYAEFGPAGNTFINNSGFFTSPKVTAGASGLVVNGGTAMTANQGTGTSVQHSTGTPTSGNCTKFDATGNTVDASFPCGTVTVAGFNAIGNIPFFGSSTSIQGTSSANLNSTGDMSVNTLVLNATGAASQEALAVPGTWFSGGTGTTTKPQVLIQPTATTSTGWSTAGTGFGVNAQSGFTGNLIDLQLNGSSKFKVDSGGGVALASIALSGGTAVTANQGTGTSLQHSTGSVTTNDCTKFDSTGNTVDAGYICTGTNESIQFPTLASALAPGDAVTFALTTTFPNGTRGILVAPYPASTDFVAAGVAVSCVEHSLGTGTAIDCTVRNISSSSIASGNNFPMILYQMP